jgi:hypothetical protein
VSPESYPTPLGAYAVLHFRRIGIATRAPALLALRAIGWFLLTQTVTVAALLFIIAALWTVSEPFGLLACGLGLIVLERKVEIDHRSAKQP